MGAKKRKATVEKPRRIAALLPILMVAIIVAAYAPAIRGPFVWDDTLLVTDNPSVTHAAGLPSIWEGSGAMDYTPLTLSSYWLEWRLWGSNTIGYHLTNICLQIGSAFLLWRILEALSIPGAFLGALLFAIHPVNAASVAWIAERKNTLSLLFYLLAVWWYLAFDTGRRSRFYLLALAAAACAFLSKGSTVVLPGVLLGCVWWRRGTVRGRDWAALLPFVGLAAAMAFVTVHFQAQIISDALARESLPFRLIRAGEAVWFYLWKDLAPVNLCMIYPQWKIDPASPLSYLPALAAAAVLALFWMRRSKWGRGPLFGAGYYLLTLLPALGFLNMGFMEQACVADWWQQLALIAPMAAVGTCAAFLWRRTPPNRRTLITGATVVLVLAFLSLTWSESAAYQSVDGFWTRILARNPDSWGAHGNFGRALRSEGKLDEAVVHYQRAIELNPGLSVNYLNLGNALRAQGKADLAISIYEGGLRINPADADLENNLGIALNQTGKKDEAAAHYRAALRINPDDPEPHNNLGILFKEQGKTAEALAEYQEALRLNPSSAIAALGIGEILQSQGHTGTALPYYQKALAQDPSLSEARWYIGAILLDGADPSQALPYLDQAYHSSPDHGQALTILTSMLDAHHMYHQSAGYYEEALAQNPDAPDLLNNYAWLLSTCPDGGVRDGAKAVALATKASQATGGANSAVLSTLAAAYAESGRFPEALATAQTALRLAQAAADNDTMQSVRQEIAQFQQGQPYRQP